MKTNLTHTRTCVYNINYHIVWSVKYRKKVITSEKEKLLRNTACQVLQKEGLIVHLMEVGEMDHVHCFVSAPPTISISYIVKMLKGTTARELMRTYPELKRIFWKGTMWNPSYYVETIGCVSEENIRRYIEKQRKEEKYATKQKRDHQI